jgi:hypothetical protein
MAPFRTGNNGALRARGSRLLLHSVGHTCNYLWRLQLVGNQYVMLHHLSDGTSAVRTANFSFCCVPIRTNIWSAKHLPPSLFSVSVCRRSWLLSFYSFYVNWCAQFLTRLRWVMKRFVVCHVCYILMLFCGTRVSRWKSFFCVTDVFAIIYSSAPRKTECATEAVLMSKHIQIITFYTLLFIST